MKLAISNIGWTKQEEPEIAKLLQSLGVKYVEIAPTKEWSEPVDIDMQTIEAYRDWWRGFGIEIIAFQSMLFAHPEYKLFEGESVRNETQKYLENFLELAGTMGVQRLVFGSPKNRQLGSTPIDEAGAIAVDFFRQLGDVAQKNHTILCIEPNAPQYNCDFITTAQQGIDIVNKVDSPGFGLHLDIACMTLAGDDITKSIHDAKVYLKHFHISSPMLEAVEDGTDVDHKAAAEALRAIDYSGYVSIEMRPCEEGQNSDRVKNAVLFAQNIYA